jgi:lysophospholipase L1-like esterase
MLRRGPQALLVVVAMSAMFSAWACSESPNHRARVAIAGDSITRLTAPYLAATLQIDYQTTIADHDGYDITRVTTFVKAEMSARPAPDAIVINAGTPDVVAGNVSKWKSDYDAMFQSTAAARCVVLFTISRLVDRFAQRSKIPSAEQINGEIRAIAATHPNVRVVDWDAAVQADTTLMFAPTPLGRQGDGIHPVDKGQHWIADHTKAAVDACKLTPTPTPTSSP